LAAPEPPLQLNTGVNVVIVPLGDCAVGATSAAAAATVTVALPLEVPPGPAQVSV